MTSDERINNLDEESTEGSNEESNEQGSVDRRRFIQGVGVAGLLGAVGMTRVFGQQADPAGAGEAEFAKPEGLRPLAQLDARFPVSYQKSVPEAMRVLTEYFAALSGRDLEAVAGTLHFPCALYEGTEPVVIESAAGLLADPPPSINVTGTGETQVKPDSYDLLDRLELQTFSPVGAGLSMSFTRYTPDGHKLAVCDGIYAIVNNDGKWGIQFASTMFTPADYVGVTYPEVENAAFARSRDWMLGYSVRDQELLNSTRIPGRSAGLAIYGPRERAGNARAGNPMDGYRAEGIASRLRVSERTQEGIDAADADFDQFAEWAGGGVGKWAYSLSLPGARVIHATVDKAHTIGGYLRYTADHTLVSETRSLGISVYRNGRWGSGGGLGNMMLHHDRTNSAR